MNKLYTYAVKCRKRKMFLVPLVLAGLIIPNISHAQVPILYYDFENTGRSAFENAVEQSVNTGSGPVTRAGTVTTFGTVGGAGSANGGSTAGYAGTSNTWSASITDPGTAASQYFQFVVNTSGFSDISISFDNQASGTGPARVGILYGIGSTFNAATTSPALTGNAVFKLAETFTLPADANNQTLVTIRIYPYAGSASDRTDRSAFGTGGTFRIDNLTVSATTATGTKTLLDYPAIGLSIKSGTAFNPTFTNFTVNGAGITVTAPSALQLAGVLTITSGTLDLGSNSLVLRSTATSTARVAAVTGTITGNVTTERYIGIPTAKRAWRFITAPLTGSGTIAANWQTGGTGSGTNISGPTGTGFDYATPGYSMKRYNVTTQKYEGVTNTGDPLFGASATAANLPFMVFIAGDKTLNIATNAGSNNTTLRATGTLQTGTQTFSQALTAAQFVAIGNPYASPVDFDALTLANAPKKFYAWDPNLNTFGGYVLVDGTAGPYTVTPNNPATPTSGAATGSGSTAQTQVIQSGQAFFVQATATGTTSVTFTEAAKSATTVNNVFRTGNGSNEQLRVNLLLDNADNTTTLADGILADYSNDFSAAIDEKDGTKFTNDNENLSIESNGTSLMVERRPLMEAGNVINLKLTKTTARNYRFSIYPANLAAANLTATLEDSYLKTSTPVSLSDITEVPFSITTDAASAAADRFKINFKAVAVLPIGFTSVKALQKDQQIQVEWAAATETNITGYEIEKSVNGRDFTKAGSVKATGSGNYTWLDVNAIEGNNFYRIKGISITGEIKYSAIVNVKMGKGKSEIVAYPNPVKGKVLSLQLSNQLKGTYTISLFNSIGQEVFTKSIQHNGGSATQTVQLNGNVVKGIYQLQVTNGETTTNQQIICD